LDIEAKRRKAARKRRRTFERGFGAFLQSIDVPVDSATQHHWIAFAVKTTTDEHGVVRNVAHLNRHISAVNAMYKELGLPSPIDKAASWWTRHVLRRASREEPMLDEPIPKAVIAAAINAFDERNIAQYRYRLALGLLWHLGCEPSYIQQMHGCDVRKHECGAIVTWYPPRRSMHGASVEVLIPFADNGPCVARSLLQWIETQQIGPNDPLLPAVIGRRVRCERPLRFFCNKNFMNEALRKGLRLAGYSKEEAARWTLFSVRFGHLVAALEAGASPYRVAYRMGYDFKTMRRLLPRLPIWHHPLAKAATR